ncbi:MAG: hypothetical protein UT63_C0007G0023 [Candidatus Gottesmanbacteria bacterium GW2011_GWC2_39_8]|uniref:Uncharacterized protein n=1 Tax=Candidatus Gottesmanbacteria bacterium GW2011_GWC2_39_8 TaxID=1618450 RepID=A0A0G0Q1Q8_9BACT|nr:MAG: hypothetical protein UT63_C0007G0023 [Candidatus Gottesmanbacteria bacterium GW2011_GWC2_39_8]
MNRKRENGPISIKMGTLFHLKGDKGDPPKTFVVTDNRPPGNHFEAFEVFRDDRGKRFIHMGGGYDTEDIGKICEEIKPSEVITLARRGARRKHYGLTRNVIDYFKSSSKKPPRIIRR